MPDPDREADPRFRELVETGARAYYEWACLNEGEDSRWDEDSPSGERARRFARSRAEVILGAVLGERVGWRTSLGLIHLGPDPSVVPPGWGPVYVINSEDVPDA